MKKNDNILQDFAIKFINEYFEELNLNNLDWNVTIEKAIKEINQKDYMASWVISEVMSWGSKIDYIKKYMVDNEDGHFIININKRYFMFDDRSSFILHEVYPKEILVKKIAFNKCN